MDVLWRDPLRVTPHSVSNLGQLSDALKLRLLLAAAGRAADGEALQVAKRLQPDSRLSRIAQLVLSRLW